MNFIDFKSFSLPAAFAVFILAAVVIWFSGVRLSKLADRLAERTGVGRAFIGLLMLGGITSLPEVATTLTASLEGNAGMAASNILGGVSMQVTILAMVDFWARKKPISASTSNIVILMQGVLLIIMLAISGAFMITPPNSIYHIGIDTFIIFVIFLFSTYIVQKFNSVAWISYDRKNRETIDRDIDILHGEEEKLENDEAGAQKENKTTVGDFLKKKGFLLIFLSLLILIAGYVVIKTAEVIAEKTGVGNSFAGLVLVAVTTSLPEISTALTSVKLKRYEMAFSNIFGTNLFDVALLFVADCLYFSGPIFGELDSFTVVASFLGIILTAVYLVGISMRSRKYFLGIGYDSWLILLTYLAGIFILFQLKG